MLRRLVLSLLCIMGIAGGNLLPVRERAIAPLEIPKPKLHYTEVFQEDGAYMGRFSVPSVGVDVACFDSREQSVVDAADSAAYFFACGHRIIGDHVNQGFGAIKRCCVGERAQLTTEQGTEHFSCVAVIQGHNTGTALTDADYTSIDNLYPDALACYTCNENWQNVTIVFFEPVSMRMDHP